MIPPWLADHQRNRPSFDASHGSVLCHRRFAVTENPWFGFLKEYLNKPSVMSQNRRRPPEMQSVWSPRQHQKSKAPMTRRIDHRSLLCVTTLASMALTQPAFAQSPDQINAIEQQIKSLQSQLSQLKADLAKRDHALRAAQQQAK